MPQEDTLTITRILEAPRERVWKACTEPAGLREWWGQPQGARMSACEVDFRVGGSFYFKVELPDGHVVWGKSIYKEIVEGVRLVLESHHSDAEGKFLDTPEWPASMITLALEDSGENTKLTVIHEGMTSQSHDIEQYKEGWSQSIDRLIAHLIH